MTNIAYDEAAHLLRRLGFGGPPEEISDLASRGREGAVDYLMDFSQIDNGGMDRLLAAGFDLSNPDDPAKFNLEEIQRWWFTRMAHTRRQFEEKITLFWHNHFATAVSKVNERFMFIQNQTLRNHALDRFDTLLLNVAQDPAMLFWLDGVTNVRGNPNENWARELQELFSMGIVDAVTEEQNYTESDVKEIARAFTGWTVRPPGRTDTNRLNYQFAIDPNQHDEGLKTVYGQTANFSGQDIVTIIAAKPATARFIAKKLFEAFAYPLTSSSADKAAIDKFANVYMTSGHSIKSVARAIFTSDEFFSSRAMFALVKSPIELVVGSVRMLGAIYNPGTLQRPGGSNILADASSFLNQQAYNPPDVAGWRPNLAWVNTSTMLNRFTYADFFASSRTANPNAPGLWLTHDQLKKLTKGSAKKTVGKFLEVLGPLPVDAATVRKLRDYLQVNDGGDVVGFSPDDRTIDQKVRGLVHLIMCLTEFQLC